VARISAALVFVSYGRVQLRHRLFVFFIRLFSADDKIFQRVSLLPYGSVLVQDHAAMRHGENGAGLVFIVHFISVAFFMVAYGVKRHADHILSRIVRLFIAAL